MYQMIEKEQIAQKRPYGGENRLKSKTKGTDATASGKQFQY